MELILKRFMDSHESTVGHLYLNGELFCATLEDTFQHEKLAGKTRIPPGRYRLKLRQDSPMAKKYQRKFGTNGMLWLQDVPGFSYIYIHIGNTDEDTRGCILVGSFIQQELKSGHLFQKVLNSTSVYIDLWARLAPDIEMGKEVFITIL